MDNIDKEIILNLRENPTIAFSKIAEKIEVSTQTVIKRFNKIKSDGIISGINTLMDLSKIGYCGKLFVFITASNNFDSKIFSKEIELIPNIFLSSELVGRFNFLVMAIVKNIVDVNELLNQISKLPGVRKVDFALTTNMEYPVTEEHAKINFLNNK